MNRFILGLLSFTLVLSSCYKEETFSTEDYDLTITHYDTEFDFTTYKTFYITDSVGLVSDYIEEGDSDWKTFYATRGGASVSIINALTKHFLDLGYVKLDSLIVNGDSADFAINTLMTLNEQTDYVYYPGYWYGYPGYWGGYWGYNNYWKEAKSTTYNSNTAYYGGGYYGGYYPWYGSGYSYTYKTGNLMIEMADGEKLLDLIKFLDDNPSLLPTDSDAPKMQYVWQAFIDGFQSDDGIERVENGIDEAFKNSPYL